MVCINRKGVNINSLFVFLHIYYQCASVNFIPQSTEGFMSRCCSSNFCLHGSVSFSVTSCLVSPVCCILIYLLVQRLKNELSVLRHFCRWTPRGCVTTPWSWIHQICRQELFFKLLRRVTRLFFWGCWVHRQDHRVIYKCHQVVVRMCRRMGVEDNEEKGHLPGGLAECAADCLSLKKKSS